MILAAFLSVTLEFQHRNLYPDFKIKMSHMLQLVTPTLLVLLEMYTTTICILNYSSINKTNDSLSSISEKILLSIKWNRVCVFPPHTHMIEVEASTIYYFSVISIIFLFSHGKWENKSIL